MLETWDESLHFLTPGPVHVCYTIADIYLHLNASKSANRPLNPLLFQTLGLSYSGLYLVNMYVTQDVPKFLISRRD